MRKRPYGTTGIELSVVGFGGILVMDETPKEAERIVSFAIDNGITYFDVAPSYGNAQERLGPALKPYRNDVFLACKTGERRAEGARRELEESLRMLQTDHFDLYQMHAVTTSEDVQTILGPGGALEVFQKAQQEGLLRYLGFSAHSEEAAVALLDAFGFDSILFPVNWVTWNTGGFGPRVLKRAQEKGAAILALKSLAKRRKEAGEPTDHPKSWYMPVESYEEARAGLRFTLSQPVTAAVSPGHEDLLRWMIRAEAEFTPLSEDEAAQIAERARELAPIFPQ